MPNDQYNISAVTSRQIIEAIRQGGSHVKAAEAAGIPWQTFYRWLRDPLFEDFQIAVRKAAALARLSAERRVFMHKPELWLTRGPGRARADDPEPGWSDEIKITASLVPAELNYDALTDAQLVALEGIRRTLVGSGDPISVVEAEASRILSPLVSRLPSGNPPTEVSGEVGSGSSGED